MLCCIVLKINPEFVGQGISGIHIRFQNVSNDRFRLFRSDVEFKFIVISVAITLSVETDNQNTFSVLRNKVLPIQNLIIHFIIEFFQRFTDHFKRASLVMTAQILDIFQHKRLRAFCFQNAADIKKQRSLCLILKARCSAKALFFGHAGN